MLLPITDVSRSRGMQFRPLSKISFYIFVANFLILMQLGAKHVESPFIEFGQLSTVLYFLYFSVIMYSVTFIENSLVDINNKGTISLLPYHLRVSSISPITDKSRSKGIQSYYISILCWVLLHNGNITTFILCFMGVYYTFKFSIDVIYCMDGATEMSIMLQDKISRVEEKIHYHQGQVIAANEDFNEHLSKKSLYENKGIIAYWQREYLLVESALKDSNTNLNSEIRMLDILKGKLESGDNAMTNTSTAGKRKITDHVMTDTSTAAKRKTTD